MFNVASGLFGFYIIRNSKNEEYLPNKTEERFIFIARESYGDFANASINDQGDVNKSSIYSNFNDGNFNTSVTYRFRILNADFDDYYKNITFSY